MDLAPNDSWHNGRQMQDRQRIAAPAWFPKRINKPIRVDTRISILPDVALPAFELDCGKEFEVQIGALRCYVIEITFAIQRPNLIRDHL